jgi:hypothetical protein
VTPAPAAVLVVAHPGHELRIHGWLERTRPRVHVLSDGSGRTGRSRLHGTESLLARAGCERGRIFGRFTDAGFYAAVLGGRHACFVEVAEQLADALCEERVDWVVADACQGYNPAHDVAAALAQTAAVLARVRSGRRIRCYDFPLVGPPAAYAGAPLWGALELRLTPAEFERKLAAAGAFPELAGEVTAAMAEGIDAFRVECLGPIRPRAGGSTPAEQPPYYERYGERQHAAGLYPEVLRFREHVLPLGQALRRHVLAAMQWKRCRS